MQRAGQLAGVSIVVFGLMALLANAGHSPIPTGPSPLAWAFLPVALAVGVISGWAAVVRARQIDRERWQTVADETLTSGEVDYAHREAERQMRVGGTIFLLGSIAFGTWLAYQFRDREQLTVAELLIVMPLVGFLVSAAVSNKLIAPVKSGVE